MSEPVKKLDEEQPAAVEDPWYDNLGRLKVYKCYGKYPWPCGFKQKSSYVYLAVDNSFVVGKLQLDSKTTKWCALHATAKLPPYDILTYENGVWVSKGPRKLYYDLTDHFYELDGDGDPVGTEQNYSSIMTVGLPVTQVLSNSVSITLISPLSNNQYTFQPAPGSDIILNGGTLDNVHVFYPGTSFTLPEYGISGMSFVRAD